MAKPYSHDLRLRIVHARQQGLTYRHIAKTLSVGVATVSRILRLHRETGDVKTRQTRWGRHFYFNESDLQQLRKLLEEKPDATLDTLREDFEERLGKPVRRGTMYKAIRRMGWTRKKSPSELLNKTPSATDG